MEILVGFASLGFLAMVNISVFAYSYGKLNQRVADLCRRIGRIEDILNGKGKG